MHPNAMAERRENGMAALAAMEAHYGNGDFADNVTDLLCDLMHAGVLPATLHRCLTLAVEHHGEECAEAAARAGDDAADAADARAEGMIP